MNYFIFFTRVIFLLFFCVEISAQDRPNVLFILVDDLGYHDLSCTGSKIYQTPNIDSLANTSVRFTNAYANYPRCVPSRYALMTGTYPIKNGEVPDDGAALGNIPTEKNFIHQFNNAGYRTAFFGKWHLGDDESSPKGLGYSVSIAAGKAGSPRSFHFPFNTPKGKNKKVKKAPIPHLDERSKAGDYLTDELTEEVIDYLQQVSDDQPFFTVLSYYAVHQPLEAKEKDIQRNQKEIAGYDFSSQPEYINEGTGRTKMRQDNPKYASMVENLDWNIGRVLNWLEKSGEAKNTIIIFSSDHGGLSNDGFNKRRLATSNFPLRAGKGWMYEGGVRIPLFIKYGDNFLPKENTKSIVMLMDIIPTLLDFVLGKKIEDIDGESFLPVLKNKKEWNDRTVFWHASSARPRNTGEGKSSAVRSGDWKLIHFYETNVIELYNLKTDPAEKNNLAEKNPKQTEALMSKLNTWKTWE